MTVVKTFQKGKGGEGRNAENGSFDWKSDSKI